MAALSQHVRRLPAPLRGSLTWDRGLEMAEHKDFIELEFEGIGFDVSNRAIDAANVMSPRAAAMFPKASLSFVRVGRDSSWLNDTFDTVFMIDVLHHVRPRSQREFLYHAISKVKPRGTLVYKDMCLRPWRKAQANPS